MRFFLKCMAVYIGLTILLMLGNEFLLNNNLDFSGSFLLSAFLSLLLTVLYGWIDEVFIQQRQPGLDE